MLTLAITLLFTLTGIIAVTTITSCLSDARAAYLQLMQEGEVIRAICNSPANTVDVRLRQNGRSAPRSVTPIVRSAPMRWHVDQVRAAA